MCIYSLLNVLNFKILQTTVIPVGLRVQNLLELILHVSQDHVDLYIEKKLYLSHLFYYVIKLP